jgi:hypothetical protein
MNSKSLFKNMIVDQLKTVKKSYTIRGLRCVNRGQFKKATILNIEKMVMALNGFNSACFNRKYTFKISSINHKNGFYSVYIGADILLGLTVENNRFSKVDINFSQKFTRSFK